MPRIYVGVHSIPDLIITPATQLMCKPPWVMGPSHVATHAFLAWRPSDGMYRLDGKSGGAVITMVERLAADPPSIMWELAGLDAASVERIMANVRKFTGAPYDYLEGLAQVTPLAHFPFHHDGFICTSLVARILAGTEHGRLLAGLPDFFPERLAQAMDAASNSGRLFRRAR